MADQIKTVTDKSQFDFMFKTFFSGSEILIKTKNGNIKLQFLGYSDDKVAFRIPHVKNMPETVKVYTRHKTNTINVSLKYTERNEDTFIFIPVRFQIISEARKEDRQLVGVEGGGKSIIFMTNIMSDELIKNSLMHSLKKVDHIEEIAKFDLEKQFNNIKLYFTSKGKVDSRMNYLLDKGKPIFVPDLNSEPEEKNIQQHNHYINEIYARDPQLSRTHKFTSEATVPIMFRKMIYYGYLQVNNTTPISDGQFEVVKRMGIVINELMIKNKVIPVENAKFLISDISQNGLGIVFRERRLARYFKQDGFISFEIMLPTSKKAIIGAKIRNINFLESNTIKVGLEISVMDDTSKINYEEYINEYTNINE